MTEPDFVSLLKAVVDDVLKPYIDARVKEEVEATLHKEIRKELDTIRIYWQTD